MNILQKNRKQPQLNTFWNLIYVLKLKICSEAQIVWQHTKYMQKTIKTQTTQKIIFSHKNIHICMKYSWEKKLCWILSSPGQELLCTSQMKRVVSVPVFWVYTAVFMAVLWPLDSRASRWWTPGLKTRAMAGFRLSRNPGDKTRKSCLAYLTPPASPSSTVSPPASIQNASDHLLPGSHCFCLSPAVWEGAQSWQQDPSAGPR